jgi:hypothetical protein
VAQPYCELVALEWAGLLTAAMTFAPNANLSQAIFSTMVLFNLLPWRSTQVQRWMMPTATVLVIIALFLPMALMGDPFTVSWNSLGTPSWLLLIAYVMTCSVSLTLVRVRSQRGEMT